MLDCFHRGDEFTLLLGTEPLEELEPSHAEDAQGAADGEVDGVKPGKAEQFAQLPRRSPTRVRGSRCAMGRRIFDNLKKAMAYLLAIHVPIAGMSLLCCIEVKKGKEQSCSNGTTHIMGEATSPQRTRLAGGAPVPRIVTTKEEVMRPVALPSFSFPLSRLDPADSPDPADFPSARTGTLVT